MTVNLLRLPPHRSDEEIVEILVETPAVRIERIISTGQTTPAGEWYDQDHDEWVVVIQGTGVLAYPDGATDELGPGDSVFLPAHRRHRVLQTSVNPACIWLAVHTPGAGTAPRDS